MEKEKRSRSSISRGERRRGEWKLPLIGKAEVLKKTKQGIKDSGSNQS